MALMISVSGIRGIAGDTLTEAVAGDFAAALGTVLGGGRVVVGRDSRPSGPNLAAAVIEALRAAGCDVIDVGLATTPGTALMILRHGAAGGVVITASHNPAPWNGLKLLNAEGLAPPLAQARRIWAVREAGRGAAVAGARRGALQQDPSADEYHVQRVLAVTGVAAVASRRFRVVLDSINGAGCASGRKLLEALGCSVVHLNGEAHGRFAHPPEPVAEHLGELCAEVRRTGADIGFAQDPDADRLAIVDENGRFIGEEFTLAFAACQVFATRPGPAAANLSTSRMIDLLAARAGEPCVVHRSPVGEANVVEVMKRHGCVIGGEGNGGVIDPRVVCVRDSLSAMALTLQLLAGERRTVSQVVASMPALTMIKQKFPCTPQGSAALLAAVAEAFADAPTNRSDGVRIDWPDGWVHIRASNTEPIVRIIAEAAGPAAAEALIERVRAVIDPFLKA